MLIAIWAAIRREPLVWFAVLGGALGVAWVLLAPAPAETVRVESETLRSLEKQREDLLGRPLTDEERQQARDSFVDEEVLLREALRRGLQWSDGRVRQRLTRIMRASMSETVPDPSVAQLQAYFQENIDKYTTPDYPHADEAAKQAWLDYRQVLRTLPSTATPTLDKDGNLGGFEWPAVPA